MHWVTYLSEAVLAIATLITPIGKALVVHCLTWPRDDTLYDGKPLPLIPLDKTELQGKHILVIGGTRGTGWGTALVSTRAGAHVTLVGRNAEVGHRSVTALQQEAKHGQETRRRQQQKHQQQQFIRYIQGDIGSIESTLKLIRRLIARNTQSAHNQNNTLQPPFDMLVVSAGIFPDWGDLRNADGWEKSYAIAVIGRYLLYRHMRQYMTTQNPRVLNILASGMQIPYLLDRSMATPHGKLPRSLPQAMIHFNTAHELMLMGLEQRGLVPPNMCFISTHPGVIVTELHRGQGRIMQYIKQL